jgi:hypothetical protein
MDTVVAYLVYFVVIAVPAGLLMMATILVLRRIQIRFKLVDVPPRDLPRGPHAGPR